MEITKGLHTLLARATQGLNGSDLIAVQYSALAAIETVVKKLRTALKAEIIGMVKVGTLSDALTRVSRLNRAESLTLLTGRTKVIIGHIKCGPAYVDMELLRDTLGISEKRWERAIVEATRHREPTMTLVVTDRSK